jgi:hypothetical protein
VPQDDQHPTPSLGAEILRAEEYLTRARAIWSIKDDGDIVNRNI